MDMSHDAGSKAQLILASESPRRRALLAQLGIEPDLICPADIDETAQPGEKPKAYGLRLAQEKAATVARQYPDSYILAADTVVSLGNRILPKALSADEARDCLHLLSGRRHRVTTAMALRYGEDFCRVKAVGSVVSFKRLSIQDVDWYLSTNEWHGKAGGYAVQGQGARFIRFISGSYSAIMGLPLFEAAGWLETHLGAFQ